MDFLSSTVSPLSLTNVGRLCEVLHIKIGCGMWHVTFKIQNTNWLWFVNGVVAAMNNDKLQRGVFGLYAAYIAGILNSVTSITFYVLCSEKLNCLDYIMKCIADKKCTISRGGDIFRLTYSGEIVYVSFEARFVRGEMPSDLVFYYAVLKKNSFALSCLSYCLSAAQ
jgi:hypothetical protein